MKLHPVILAFLCTMACSYDTSVLGGLARSPDAGFDAAGSDTVTLPIDSMAGSTPEGGQGDAELLIGGQGGDAPSGGQGGTGGSTPEGGTAGSTPMPGGSGGTSTTGGQGGSAGSNSMTGGQGGVAGSTPMGGNAGNSSTGGQGGTNPSCPSYDIPKAPPCAAQGMCDGSLVVAWGDYYYTTRGGNCALIGFGPLTIESAEENAFIAAQFWVVRLPYKAPWECLSYTAWGPGQPNNNDNRGIPEDCVITSVGLWNDRACDFPGGPYGAGCKARK